MKNFVGFTLGCLFAFLSSGITPFDGAGRGSERARHHRYGQE